jgi:hypothetical protein
LYATKPIVVYTARHVSTTARTTWRRRGEERRGEEGRGEEGIG